MCYNLRNDHLINLEIFSIFAILVAVKRARFSIGPYTDTPCGLSLGLFNH